MVTIYDQHNRPIDLRAARKPEKRELAVAPLMDAFREYVNDGLTPERLAGVFKRADGGDVRSQADLFELLEERDGHVLCERDKRRNVIVDLEYSVEPADDDRRSTEVADFVEKFISSQSDWDENLVTLQDAVGKGYSALEIFWDTSEGQAVPEKFGALPQKRFSFVDEKGILSQIPRLLTDTDAMGVEIPAWKTIMHRYGGKTGAANRSGIYRVATWMVLFKNYAIKDWVIFCELFGMPVRIGKYAPGASDADKEALFSAIRSIGHDAAAVVSESTAIEFVESAKGATASDLWEKLANFCNAEISKAILGQTLSSQVGKSGSYAAAKTHNEVRLDLLKADGKALAGTIRQQLIRPLVGFNFGWDTPVPKFISKYKASTDLNKASEWVERVMKVGTPMPVSFLNKTFNIPEPEKGEEVIRFQQPSAPQPTAAKMVAKTQVADGGPVTAQALVEKALNDPQMDGLIDPVKALLDQVESLEEFRDRLADIFADIDPLEFGNRLAKWLALAELSGRFDVEGENAENGP